MNPDSRFRLFFYGYILDLFERSTKMQPNIIGEQIQITVNNNYAKATVVGFRFIEL